MFGVQPDKLTNAELAHYAWLAGEANLPAVWIRELIERLEAAQQRIEYLESLVPSCGVA